MTEYEATQVDAVDSSHLDENHQDARAAAAADDGARRPVVDHLLSEQRRCAAVRAAACHSRHLGAEHLASAGRRWRFRRAPPSRPSCRAEALGLHAFGWVAQLHEPARHGLDEGRRAADEGAWIVTRRPGDFAEKLGIDAARVPASSPVAVSGSACERPRRRPSAPRARHGRSRLRASETSRGGGPACRFRLRSRCLSIALQRHDPRAAGRRGAAGRRPRDPRRSSRRRARAARSRRLRAAPPSGRGRPRRHRDARR